MRGNVEPELTGGECECEGSSKSQDCKGLESRRWNEVEINFKINSELVPGSGLRCGWRDFDLIQGQTSMSAGPRVPEAWETNCCPLAKSRSAGPGWRHLSVGEYRELES